MAAQGVNDACAHAVKPAGHLVALAAEFAAGVKDGQADLHRGTTQLGMNADGKAAAVVAHLAASIPMQEDVDVRTETGQRLVNSVVHNFIHAMMQPAKIRAADIHARTFPNGFEALQHLDLRFVVHVFIHGGRAGRDAFRQEVLVHFWGLIGHCIPLPLRAAAPVVA